MPRTAHAHKGGGGRTEEEEGEEEMVVVGEKNPQFQLLPERLLWGSGLCAEVGTESK